MYFTLFLLLFIFKMYVLRITIFNDPVFSNTLLFEASLIIFIMMLLELFIPKKGKPLMYLGLNIVFSLVLLSIALYYSAFDRVPNVKTLGQAGQLGTIKESVYTLVDAKQILFFIDIIIIAGLMIIRKFPISSMKRFHIKSIVITMIVTLLVSAWNVISLNGKTENSVAAAKMKGLLNYQVAEMIAHDNTMPVTNIKGLSNKGINHVIQNLKETNSNKEKEYFGAAEGKNLIMIQVESMQNFVIDLEVDGREVTPSLNNLVEESFYFNNLYQQVGPANTADAELMFNTSVYPMGDKPTSVDYGDKAFPSLPRTLKDMGYDSLTFHTDNKTFWNRDELYPSLGIEEIYDKDFYGKDDVIGIASSDEVLFGKGLQILKKKEEPFYSQFITLTSHHPFEIPKEKEIMPLPSHLEGTTLGNYLQSIHYTDKAVGKFIEDLKHAGLYEDSVIVIYGDHVAPIKEEKMVSDIIGHEYSSLDKFNLPFIIHSSGLTDEGKVFEQTGGQLDMMPTVANILGVSLENFVHFGQDLLNNENNLVGMRFYLPTGSFFTDDVFYTPGTSFDDGMAITIKTREPVELTDELEEKYNNIIKLESLSDQYVKLLPKHKKSGEE